MIRVRRIESGCIERDPFRYLRYRFTFVRVILSKTARDSRNNRNIPDDDN